jgi:hypothetical protein
VNQPAREQRIFMSPDIARLRQSIVPIITFRIFQTRFPIRDPNRMGNAVSLIFIDCLDKRPKTDGVK